MTTPIAISSWRSRDEAGGRDPQRPGAGRACRRPRRKSDRSLARLAATWSSSATARQPSAVSSRNGVPTASAAPSPTRTPRERGRAASRDATASEPDPERRRAGRGRGGGGHRAAHGRRGYLREVGRALLEERGASPRAPRRSCSTGPVALPANSWSPARPSVATRNADLRKRIAVGLIVEDLVRPLRRPRPRARRAARPG